MSAPSSKSGKRRGNVPSASTWPPRRWPLPGLPSRRSILRVGTILLCATALALGLRLAKRPLSGFLAQRQLSRAQEMLAGGHAEEAAAALRETLRWWPTSAEARALLGGLELQRGRIEHAFLEFQALTELEPRNVSGWVGLAQVRDRAAQWQEAEAAMDRVLELAPERSGAHTVRSELRYRLGRYQGAFVDAQRAVRQDPGDARGWVAMVRAAGRLKGPSAALEAAETGTLRDQGRRLPGARTRLAASGRPTTGPQ